MAFLHYLIITLHIVACLFLIAVVLLQQGKGQDLASAFGGGGTQTAFGPRGSAPGPSPAPAGHPAPPAHAGQVVSSRAGPSPEAPSPPAAAAASPTPAAAPRPG